MSEMTEKQLSELVIKLREKLRDADAISLDQLNEYKDAKRRLVELQERKAEENG